MLVLLPLWSSYLVRVYAWRVILAQAGRSTGRSQPIGIPGVVLYPSDIAILTRLHLHLAAVHDPAASTRGWSASPSSFLEASADLGARPGTTFRRVVLPLAFPAVVAGSIFTFSLTLGDYITPPLVSNSQFIGNVDLREPGRRRQHPVRGGLRDRPGR